MRATAVVGLGLALAAVGCGSDTIDAAEVEAGIEQSLSSATASVSSVSCPNDVNKEEGATFTCDAKLEGGGKAKVKVTQTSKGGDFTYAFKPGTVVLTDDTVEPALEKTWPRAACPTRRSTARTRSRSRKASRSLAQPQAPGGVTAS